MGEPPDSRGPIVLEPIGMVRSPLTDPAAAPKQGVEGSPDAWLVLEPHVLEGLDGVAPGQELIVVTWLDRARRDVLRVHPRGDPANPERGVFTTRSPHRPNPIGLHRVRVVSVDGPRMLVREALDGTPSQRGGRRRGRDRAPARRRRRRLRLYVYRVLEDGTRVPVASPADGDSHETAIVEKPIPGDYIYRVVNWLAFQPTWDVTIGWYKAGETVFKAGTVESWTLTCESATGTVLAEHKVIIDRGERKLIGGVCTRKTK